MRVAIVTSNMFRVSKTAKKGTEILSHIFLDGLAEYAKTHNDLSVTVFASGDSIVPFPVTSINATATSEDKRYNPNDQKLLELALISKAFSMVDQFDVFHIHISNCEYVLPFAPLVPKPILITMHGAIPNEVGREYYRLFRDITNVYFVAISESQKNQMPDVQYAGVIHHGINAATSFIMSETGGEKLMWAGRGIPEKGLDTVLEVVAKTHREAKLFPILKPEYLDWFQHNVLDKRDEMLSDFAMEMNINLTRRELVEEYQSAKLFLFPIAWEEPFGLVMIEAMACGTPVVALARGSVPELIIDGKTGFVVNSSVNDVRGDFVIKSFGLEGLIEAVERIYNMSHNEYRAFRRDCREHVEQHFTRQRMINQYLELYKKLTGKD